MNKIPARPNWWALYMYCAFFLGLFFLEANAQLTKTGHTWAEISLVLLLFGGIWLWLEKNGGGFVP